MERNIEDYFSTEDQIQEAYGRLKKSVRSKRAHPISYRKEQLKQMNKIIQNEKEVIAEALKKDLNKGYSEGILMELASIDNEIRLTLARLDEWVKPEYASKSMLYAMDNVHIVHDPYGLVLILGAWNYPVQLVLMPLVGAIAGGNCAVIKPSEVSSHSAIVVTDLITKYLDPECYAVLNGSAKEAQKLLSYRWDHIFYTGNNKIAKYVMKAAAENLTPVTLELGGKNPAYVHSDVDYKVTGQRIAWAKFMNVGQTCIAPDYVLCHESAVDGLCDALITAAKKFYTDKPQEFGEYGRIVSKNHFQRVTTMLDNTRGEVILGGERDEDDRYLAPTIVKNVKLDDSLMEDEIFGPVIPVISVESYQKAVDIINDIGELLTNTGNELVKLSLQARFACLHCAAGGHFVSAGGVLWAPRLTLINYKLDNNINT